jgi:rSAM/selenodomain-associated transferase 1
MDRLAGVGSRRYLAFAPAEAEAAFRQLSCGRYELAAQGDGDLGARMARFIAARQRGGASAVVIVGADSPTLPMDYVEQAFTLLQTADVVIGPACDGGYYLIGCGPRLPPVFEGITWGGPRVLAETVAALADPQWRLALLPPWYDVDTPADWDMLCGHLAALRRAGIDPRAPHTEGLAL